MNVPINDLLQRGDPFRFLTELGRDAVLAELGQLAGARLASELLNDVYGEIESLRERESQLSAQLTEVRAEREVLLDRQVDAQAALVKAQRRGNDAEAAERLCEVTKELSCTLTAPLENQLRDIATRLHFLAKLETSLKSALAEPRETPELDYILGR